MPIQRRAHCARPLPRCPLPTVIRAEYRTCPLSTLANSLTLSVFHSPSLNSRQLSLEMGGRWITKSAGQHNGREFEGRGRSGRCAYAPKAVRGLSGAHPPAAPHALRRRGRYGWALRLLCLYLSIALVTRREHSYIVHSGITFLREYRYRYNSLFV